MTAVLADLSLESEAATWLAMRLARAFDASAADDDSPVERAWRRVVLPAAKFWVCKRALELAGVRVAPGDWVCLDRDGVVFVSVPRARGTACSARRP